MMAVEITDMVNAATCKYRTIPMMTDEDRRSRKLASFVRLGAVQ